MTTTLRLLDALCTHLGGFELPDPASAQVCTYTPEISVQLGCRELPQIAAALLGWADTLTEPTAQAWRIPQGNRVHLSVRGQLSQGLSVLVYGGVAFTTYGPGGQLTPGASTPLPLGALRHLADLGEMPDDDHH